MFLDEGIIGSGFLGQELVVEVGFDIAAVVVVSGCGVIGDCIQVFFDCLPLAGIDFQAFFGEGYFQLQGVFHISVSFR